LNLVKALVMSKRFIIVVPTVVVADLDGLKKTSAAAREAIRWLEGEAQKGTRSVKFQRENERLSLAPIKYPRRKDKEAFDFYLLLEHCSYLNQNQQNTASPPELKMVTLLTGSSHRFPANASVVARTAGINMENIEVFVSKWRNSTKAKT
jgi:protein SMG5